MKRAKSFLVVLVFMVFTFVNLQGVALAINVGYLHGNTDYQESVRGYLDGQFDSVTLIDGNAETLPTLSELMAYDAILASTNWPWSYVNRSDNLGNLLADYVDAGGGLVMTTFSWQYQGVNGLGGRLLNGGYSPFTGGSNLYSYASALGNYTLHPIMSGVNTVDGYYRDAVTPSNDAQVIANWSDSVPFVAVDSGSGVVGINVFPEDSAGDISGDYAQLFVNALNWAASGKTKSKNGTGWLVTIDGMEIGASYYLGWPDMPSMYLYDAITPEWRSKIMQDLGSISPFTWSRDISQTSEAVEQLYQKIKELSKTNRPITILSHSWGTMIAYIMMMEHGDIQVEKLITLGSPLDVSPYVVTEIFTVKDMWLRSFDISTVDKPTNLNVWHNYWTGCDPVAAPITTLSNNDNYKNKTVYRWLGIPDPFACHASYFEDAKQWDKILQDVVSK